MKKAIFIISLALVFCYLGSCHRKNEIFSLLNSHEKEDLIKGSYEAGESGNEEFVPLLLKNANDIRVSTNLKFKGYNVYQEKMMALSKIYKRKPPVPITSKPTQLLLNFTPGYRKIMLVKYLWVNNHFVMVNGFVLVVLEG